MVCTFMLIVLPAMILRSLYGFWCWLIGRKPAEQPKQEEVDPAKAQKGTCPYHTVRRWLGFPVPEKNAETTSNQSEESTAEEANTEKVKAN